MSPSFSYAEAFSRNLGWVSVDEQEMLRQKTIAIAGLGGVGGAHLLTLTRLGVGRFRIADFDRFGLVNFNRQAGALMSTLDEPKAQVLARMARDINPDVEIQIFDRGVEASNLDRFLVGADVYVDGLDFFAFDARAATFAACARLQIPAITAAPLGTGTAVLTFLPDGMSFEEYFQWGTASEDDKALRFMIGLAPRLLQDYLVDSTYLDLAARRGPSTVMGCQLCAGVAATEVLKILLHRGVLRVAPHGMQFDPYRNKFVKTWRPWGNRNPIQRLMLAIARHRLVKMRKGHLT